MTALPPDPDPAETPDLEAGGGVAPGATPPDSAQTSGLGEPEPRPRHRHRYTPTSVTAIIALVLLVAVFVAVGVLLILQMSGVFE